MLTQVRPMCVCSFRARGMNSSSGVEEEKRNEASEANQENSNRFLARDDRGFHPDLRELKCNDLA